MSLFDSFRAPSFAEITPDAIASVKGKSRLIDVREPSEFNDQLGHIAGAELVPLGTIGAIAPTWDKSQPLVVICRSGGRSGRACQQLASMGFASVTNMSGGMLAYNAAGLPVERR